MRNLLNITQLKSNSNLSLAMKEKITEITVGFQEMNINRDSRYHVISSSSTLILGLIHAVERIDQWLAPPLPSSNYNAAMKKRQAKTGEWFLHSKEFADWKTGTSPFIWLHGIRKLQKPHHKRGFH